MKKVNFRIMVAAILLLTLGLDSLVAFAGGGTYEGGDPDLLTLNVLFEFDTSANFDPNSSWEGAFNRASELLYNATDGQVQIGTVNFYNNCPQVVDQDRQRMSSDKLLDRRLNHVVMSVGVGTRDEHWHAALLDHALLEC